MYIVLLFISLVYILYREGFSLGGKEKPSGKRKPALEAFLGWQKAFMEKPARRGFLE
jgi:hypothetical protein